MSVLAPPFFVISDLHFFHDEIIAHCDRPYDHEKMITKRWRSVIKPSDVVLCLGDIFLGGDDGYRRFQEIALPGHKYLIRGNHDKRRFDYEALGFIVIKPFSFDYKGYQVSFDHYPKRLEEHKCEKRIHVHGHIHNHGYGPKGHAKRYGNINVSAEQVDYRPQRITALLNAEIHRRRGRGASRGYYNKNGNRTLRHSTSVILKGKR